jgi:hypothetical protein
MFCERLDAKFWEMKLTPHRPGDPIEFNMRIDPVSDGNFTGIVEVGGVETDIRSGRCITDDVTRLTYISLIVEIGETHYSLAGAATEPVGSSLLRFSGSYIEIVRPSDDLKAREIVPFEPGDTGTGAGQQSGVV